MNPTTDVPIRIEPAAAERVRELGLQAELDCVLDHTQKTVADLRRLEVALYDDPDEPGKPRVHLLAVVNHADSPDDALDATWGRWFVAAFPPEVCRWFGFDVRYRGEDEQ
jgi:hypothetical protein